MDLVNLQITANLLPCRDRHYAGCQFFGLSSRKTYRSFQKLESVSLRDLLSTDHLLGVPFITSLRSNLCTAVITLHTTENKCTILHTQNTTLLQRNAFLTGIHWLLVTAKQRFNHVNFLRWFHVNLSVVFIKIWSIVHGVALCVAAMEKALI